MPTRFQFSLRALFAITALVGLAVSCLLAVIHQPLIGRFACAIGVMIVLMALVTGALIVSDLSKSAERLNHRKLIPVLVLGAIYGLSLPWLLLRMLIYLIGSS
jgi:hypothetical protein